MSCVHGFPDAQHWAFQPLVRPSVPAISGESRIPVDAFILTVLNKNGLSFSEEADRRTLIRRVYFDLVGLPPTPEQARKFIDGRVTYENVVESLLGSPAYGERWARHGLDLVRFAESHGFGATGIM